MTIPVKWFSSDMVGAPALSKSVGSGISVLDACLVNGFNTKTLSSLVVINGTATGTVSNGHGFTSEVVVAISGCTSPWTALNDEFRVTSTQVNTFTFATTVVNGTATGTIQAKVAPLGWTKLYSATGLAAYKPTLQNRVPQNILRVDDNQTSDDYQSMRVISCETMSDINTWDYKCPTEKQIAGGLFWEKNRNSGGPYRIIGDPTFFYFIPEFIWNNGSSAGGAGYGYGDIIAFKVTDAYSTIIIGEELNAGNPSINCHFNYYNGFSSGLWGCYIQRNYTSDVNSTIQAYGNGSSANNAKGVDDGSSSIEIYPSPYTSNLLFHDIVMVDATTVRVSRGFLPGQYNIHQAMNNVSPNPSKTKIEDAFGTGKHGIILSVAGVGASSAIQRFGFFDYMGPWR
jgi:hypothetical protein